MDEAEKDREIEIQAAVFVVLMLLCGGFFYLCSALTTNKNATVTTVEPTQKICQNLLQAQRVTKCIPQPNTLSLFLEQAFPVGEVDLQYVETAMSGFELDGQKKANGFEIYTYYLRRFQVVEFTFHKNQLKAVRSYQID